MSIADRLSGMRIRRAVKRAARSNTPYYLCSYPKTGRTWLRFMVSTYLDALYGNGEGVDLTTMFRVVPNLSTHPRRGPAGFSLGHQPAAPLVMASHAVYDEREFDPAVGIIFILRSVHDVIVSSYFHSTRQRRPGERFTGDIGGFIDDDARGVQRFIRYHNAFAGRIAAGNAHVATYEGLESDTGAELGAVLDFLGVERNDALIEAAVERGGFRSMQQLEQSGGIDGQHHDRDDPEARRVRRGQVGGWVDYLDEEQAGRITAACAAGLSDAAKQMFAGRGYEF